MKLFIRTVKYRLKQNFKSAGSLVMLLIALAVAVYPLLTIKDEEKEQQPVSIGWIDEDSSFYSSQLFDATGALELLNVKTGEQQQLLDELRAGNLEAVFVVNPGFEDKIINGEYEDTLTMYKSPYSSVAGVISEGVGAEVMHLWLARYSSKVAAEYDSSLETKVFDAVMTYMAKPIMNIQRIGPSGTYKAADPLIVAASRSVFFTAAVCALFIMLCAVNAGGADFIQRLDSQNLSISGFRLAVSIADSAFFLPCVLPAAAAFTAAGHYTEAASYIIMFSLYLFAFGGIASALCRIKSKTIHMISITAAALVNLGFGSLLVKLPEVGIVPKLAYILPSKWLTSLGASGFWICLAGLAASAAVYNSIVFIRRKRKKEV